MDDKVRTVDDDEEGRREGAEESGPLGRLLEQSTSSEAESQVRTQGSTNTPSGPAAASTDYAEGTHEHDDDEAY